MHAYYIHTLYYMHIVDTYMSAVCINIYMIMFNVCITVLACLDSYVRAAILIAVRLQIDVGSSYSDY